MTVPGWLMMNMYSLIMGIYLLFYTRKHTSKKVMQADNIFTSLTVLLMALLVADAMGRVPGNTETELFILRVGNFLIYLLDPFIGYLIIRYVDSWSMHVKKGQKIIVNFVGVIIILNIILVTISNVFDLRWFYYVTDKGEYFRGPFYLIRASIILGIVFVVEFYIFLYKEYIDMRYKKTMMYFPIMPLVFGILQIFIDGYALEYTGMMLTCALLFIYVQNKNVDEDFLTKTMNKRYFESVLEDKIKGFKIRKRKFGVVMIDLDYFKHINDEYGHVAGDQALMKISDILRTSFRKNDTICRFGGDEFCVIVDVEYDDEIEKILKRVNKKIKTFNEVSNTYKLSISAGHLIYEEGETLETFMNRVDEEMYIRKEERHRKLAELNKAKA